ncbi:MAG TPA: molybdopterin molybdotransferase MoeA [Caulobacteraceae bacterium]|nr:molybdopterin molybdotransferase MoeA [Caulobacteraceae bacterium]
MDHPLDIAEAADCDVGGLPRWETALARLLAAATVLEPEEIPLEAAAGRVLAAPVIAPRNRPARDLSAMDGYAIAGSAPEPGAELPIIGRAWAGRPFAGRLAKGHAVRITTGAPMPSGAERVIVDEAVSVEGSLVRITRPSGEKRHVRPIGSDFRAGDVLVAAATRLTPPALMAAAAAEASRVLVRQEPRLAILAVGDELARDERCGDDAIPDSASPGVGALAQTWGAQVVGRRRCSDDANDLAAAVGELLEGCDLLAVIGGASGSERDLTRAAAAKAGAGPLFAGVSIKPGKPAWAASTGARLVVGLPGNPVAALVAARLLLVPTLVKMTGRDPSAALAWRRAPTTANLGATGERETLVLAEAVGGSVTPLDRQESASHAQLARLTALIRRRAASAPAAADELVDYLDL